MRVKRRIFSGAVCEQEVFTVSDRIKDLGKASPKLRFATEAERDKHKIDISRRKHARKVNANFSPTSLYTTLTLDNDHEVHTFYEAKRIYENYKKRLQYINPDAQVMAHMGRGKNASRIHFHMLTNGLTAEDITIKWTAGSVVRIENLRENNKLADGTNVGRDYTGLANYLFDHWTPEQGGHRWRQTNNLKPPDREKPTVARVKYTKERPPRMPAGWKLIEVKGNSFGYLYYKYVLIPEKKRTARQRE